MFNIKYNVFIILQIIIGIINTILLMRVFGVSLQSDVYLLCISIFTMISLFLLTPIAQFMAYYNDLKNKSLKQAQEFYNCSFLFSIIFGIITFIFINISLDLIISVVAHNIDIERHFMLRKMIKIITLSFLLYPVYILNGKLLNAEMRFSIPYLLSIIPNLATVITQILLIAINNKNIYALAYAQSIGYILVGIISICYIFRYIIKFKFVMWCSTMPDFIKNSSVMQISNNLWAIIIPFVTNNFLLLYPNGYISYYYYAQKITDIVNNITTGPATKILCARISKNYAQKKLFYIKQDSLKFLLFGSILFILAVIVAYFVQKPLLQIITNNQVAQYGYSTIANLFLVLCLWKYIIFIEEPFVNIIFQAKKSKTIFSINILFIIIFTSFVYTLNSTFGIYSVVLSLIIAQLSNFLLHYKISKKLLRDL